MAVTKKLTGQTLRMRNVKDMDDGKTKNVNRDVSKILTAASPDAILAVAGAYDALTTMTMESAYVVTSEELING
ncbi:DUF1659 domain-containing protein [Pseudoramibacter sp.]|jgi:hypothetical protein|uniref:DUF1659 domain-containing protein n=1 Tax=Pseudoramibacter sp. TaxID=2034862 RepID=UPI0025DB7A65|nr:hypothetical protein [Pseudoramibacter sp.]MCH4071664.1 hypothetical protein [Pseudoramibacter sp.]MCH4105432.1 hypothetical protein [Pseudoramibacter sp.]